jgi:uncharacterized membrane protein
VEEFGCLFAVLAAIGLIVWIAYSSSARQSDRMKQEKALRDLRADLSAARKDIDHLGAVVTRLQKELTSARLPETAPAVPPPAPVEPVPPVVTPTPLPEPVFVPLAIPEPAPAPGHEEVPWAAQVPPSASDTQPLVLAEVEAKPEPKPETRPQPAPEVPPVPLAMPERITMPAAPAPSAARPAPRPAPAYAPPRPKPVVPAAAPKIKKPSQPFDWESLIGVKLFSWIAGIALLVAAIAFLKYGIEHGWLTTTVRMTIGLITGAGLLGFCETKQAQRYAVTAQSLTAAGIAILFSTFFASTSLWGMMPAWAAFLCMVVVAAVAVMLSIRRNSIFIALLGLLGGFATPALLSTGQDHPVGLFSYLAVLNIGLAWVGYRKQWPILKALSLVFTAVYQLGWVLKFLDTAETAGQGLEMGIGLGAFLLFPLIAFGTLFFGERQRKDEGEPVHPIFRYSTTFSFIPPLLFALHLATMPAYGSHYAMMFGFLALVAAGLAAIAIFHGPEWLHTLGAGSVLVVWSGWLAASYHRAEAWPWVLAFVALFVLIYLAVPLLQQKLGRAPFDSYGRLGVYAAPLLIAVFPALIALEDATVNPWLCFGTMLALGLLLAAFAIGQDDRKIHYFSGFFMIVAEVVWSARHLAPERLKDALLIYGAVTLFTLGVPWLARYKRRAWGSSADLALLLGALPPLFFAVFSLTAPSYSQHFMMVFSFLACLVVWVAVLAIYHGPLWLNGVSGVFTLMAWMGWLVNYTQGAWPAVFGFLALFVGIHLGIGALVERRKLASDTGSIAVLTAPLLLFVFPALVMLDVASAAPGLIFGVLLGLMLVLSAYAIRYEKGLVHFIGCFFVLLAEGFWSSQYLKPETLMPALAIYGGFGLFYLGVPIYAQAKGKVLKPAGSGAILALASLGLLFFMAFGSVAEHGLSLWPMAILVGMLNLGLLYEASQGHRPSLCLTGMILSWILLGCWWFNARVEEKLVPALAVMGAFGVLVVGGNLWLRTRPDPSGKPSTFSEPGLFLGLAGHLFLLAVVVNHRLSLPPWPWLGVLFVLVLALGIAALYIRRGALQFGAILATQLVLIAWAGALPGHSTWADTALWIPVFFALIGYIWDELGRVRGVEGQLFTVSAGVGIFMAQLALIVLGNENMGASHGNLTAAHAVLALLLLTLAWRRKQHGWALGLSVSMGIILLAWRLTHPFHLLEDFWIHAGWRQELVLAAPFYALLLGYPLALSERTRPYRTPFIAALTGSGIFFLAAWEALVSGGYKGVIGALPVVQALLLVPHLLLLLRLEPEGKRDLGRLAAVAGGILAFITVAIPLQLDKEWITLGWALLAASLAWLYTRVPHKGLLAWTAALLATVFARLVLNPAIFDYHPRTGVPVLNWYLYTYLVAAVCFFVAAWILRRTDDRVLGLPRLSTILPAGGAILVFLLLNIEIADTFSEGAALTFNLFHGALAQQLSYTIGWAIYAIGLLIAGVIGHSRFTRVAAIILLTLTVAKAFLLDLRQLEGLYRVASFVGLAISLALVAVVLQRFVLHQSENEAES